MTTQTVTLPSGETFALDFHSIGSQFQFASIYRSADGQWFPKYHRTEAAAAKGQWDSPAMRKVWHLVGHGPIVRQ